MALGPLSSGGIIPFVLTTSSTAGNAVVQITNYPAQLMFVAAGNNNAAPRFLRFYDTAAVGSGNGVNAYALFEIPGNTGGAGTNIMISPGPPSMSGLQFTAGIAAAITNDSTIASTSGISGVNDVFATIGFHT